MKNFLLFIFLLSSAFGFSQNYQQEWQQVVSLEIEGRVESAEELVSGILKKAKKDKDFPNLIKAKIYSYKFYQVNNENSDQYILQDINETLAELPVPYRNLLHSYKAEFLEQYFSRHRWKIRNRSKIDDPDRADLATWSEAILQDSIRRSYELSLRNKEELMKTAMDEVEVLIAPEHLNRKYRPTLFDLLAYRALEYYSDSSNFPNVKPSEEYAFNDEQLFEVSEEFREISFSKAAEESSAVKVLKTYQELEKLHAGDKDPTAFVFVQLQRLDYVKEFYRGSQKWQKYLSALDRLSGQYEDHPVNALLKYSRAMAYFDQAEEKDNEEKLLHPDYNRKAAALAEEIIEQYPQTEIEQKAFRLLSAIKAVHINTSIPNYLLPKKAGRMLISYKSLDSLQLKIFKIPPRGPANFDYHTSRSYIEEYVDDLRPVFQDSIILPQSEDYNFHSTEVILPPMEKGTYMVYLSGKNSFGKEGFSYGFIKVTNLTLSQTSFARYNLYRSLNRTTGEALENVRLVWKYKGSKSEKVTDKNGEVSHVKGGFNENLQYLMATKDGDTLITYYPRGYYREKEKEQPKKGKTLLYLDRAIYRPGQKVYFKGVLLSHDNGQTQTVPNEYVPVFVEDPNGEQINEFRLKTNKYGSFHGEFDLPKTGITGRFSIHTEEDVDSETPFWEAMWDYDSYDDRHTYFNVEEYKRPTFEVSFDELRKSYKFGDTVEVTGKASAFMGSSISNAPVTFHVNRRKLVHHWWYYDYSDPVFITSDTITTDANGNFRISFPAEISSDDEGNENLIYEYQIKASVKDVSGETREAKTVLKMGKKNLLVNLQIPQTLRIPDTLAMKIAATNLNDNPVPVKGSLKIYKLKSPDRILQERLWPAPEIQTIPEEKFKELFPEEPYERQLPPEEWPKLDLVFSSEFETDESQEFLIPVDEKWKAGKYIAEVEVANPENSATSKRIFEVVDPVDTSMADNQRFSAGVETVQTQNGRNIELLLQTAYKDLNVHVAVYDKDEVVFSQFVNFSGKKLVQIPLDDISATELEVQISGVKNNSGISERQRVKLPKPEKTLKITTETFRNKIEPGTEETWSFTIKDAEDKVPDAEILASMYDMSLDQFRTQSWPTDPEFIRDYSSFPYYQLSNVGGTSSLWNNFPSPWQYRPETRNFDKLQFFGFEMSNPESYRFYQYLRSQKNSEKGLVGNTRGIVTDEKGMPLAGVNVIIDGTNRGTQTNFDGKFAIDTEAGDQLVFSYVGFETKSFLMGKVREVFVILEQDSAMLHEVVSVAYAVEEAEEALQGQVAGLSVGNQIRIRGASSISGEATPIYVVDGKIVTNYQIDREEVLKIDVLDPSEAMAIYGSKAAQGAVIITTKNGRDLQQVEARKKLDETAFFFPQLNLDEEGKLKFSFTSPEALTRWKLRLLAHTPNWTTGEYQNTVRTQKELSVTPNPPRFLREGDNIVFKSKISNLSPELMTGTAILQLFDALTMQPIDTLLGNINNLRNFSAQASGSTVVSWDLAIPEDVQAVTYRVLAKSGDFSDGEENFLPVLTNRMLVKESLPFFVRSGETESFVFENLAENDSETLKHHKYTVEYSSNPAWYALQALPYLMEYEHECSEQTFARLYANAIAAHIVNSRPVIREVFEAWKKDSSLISSLEKREELKDLILAETPWVRDAASETAQKQLMAQLFDRERLQREQKELLARLGQMQMFSGAWSWFPGGRSNPFITRHIVAGLGHLERLGVELEDSEIVKSAMSYMDNQILREEQAANKEEAFYERVSVLHHLYARSFFLEEFPLSTDVNTVAVKVLAANKEIWLEKDLYEKALLILTSLRFGEVDLAMKIATSLKESAVRSDEYGLYWKSNRNSWYWYRAPVETQALLIEAFSELEGENQVVEEMKIWLLQNKRTNHWPSTKATTEASYALLMQGNDWLQTNDNTVIKVAEEVIPEEKLAGVKKEAGTGYMKVNWQAEEINDSFSKITVKNNNSTAGYGGAYWQYFEDLDKIKDHSTDLMNVEKELYLNVTGNSGTTLQKITPETLLQVGDLVTVRLVVRTTADMDFIHLKDMRASGFEPTNVLSEYKYQDGTAYYESTRDAATHFFFDELRKGTYVLEYTVRANNAGVFSNGITSIESMYAPEFSGHTKGIEVEIRE